MPNFFKTKTLTIAVIITVSLLIPNSVYPLGIGNIRVQSKLNQKLKAEIALLGSTNENLSDISVRLAPAGKFSEAKIPWNASIKSIRFKPIKKANGTIVVEVSSAEVFKELYLNFILEVVWNKGVLYREFTVLFDPPDDYNLPISSPTIPKHPILTTDETSFSKIWDTEKKIEKPEKKDKTSVLYGPVKSTDYIRKIAKKTRYDDVSTEQMIIALFKANPDAFFTDNVNALIEKKMLKIPKKEKVLELSRKEASEQVNSYNKIWQERLAAKKTGSPIDESIAKNDTVMPLEDEVQIQEKPTISPVAKNEPSTPQDVTLEKKPSADASNSSEILLAILTRMDKLEQKVDGINTIISSKPLAVTPSNPTSAQNNVEIKTEPSATSAENLALLAKVKDLEQKVETMQKAIQSKDELIASLQEQHKVAITGEVKSIPQLPTTPKSSKDVTSAKQPAATESITEEFIQWLKTNSTLLLEIGAIIGGFLGVLACLQWFNERKQKQAEMQALNDYFKPLDITKTSYKDSDAPINDFLSNHHLLDIQVEEHEVDVGLQLEIFLSFSDYKGAEALMIQAIKDHPENDEYKLKLLDIFVMSNNRSDFDSFKEKLKNTVKPSYQQFWDRINQMEKQLIAKNMQVIQTISDVKKDDVIMADDYRHWAKTIKKEEPSDSLTTHAPNIHANTSDVDEIEVKPVEEESFDYYQSTLSEEIESDVDKIQVPVTEEHGESFDYHQTNNEIEFDIDFDKIETPSITDTQTTIGNEIEFDIDDFNEVEIKTDVNNYQTTMGNEIEFDIDDFDEIVIKTDVNNHQTTMGNEIEFDINDFDEIEIQSLTNASLQSIGNHQTTTISQIEFDMSVFDEIDNKSVAKKKN